MKDREKWMDLCGPPPQKAIPRHSREAYFTCTLASTDFATTDPTLTFVGIALCSTEETHGCIVLDLLRTVDRPDDLLKSTNRTLAKRSMSSNLFEVALPRIEITPDFNENFVIRHRRTPSGLRAGVYQRDFAQAKTVK